MPARRYHGSNGNELYGYRQSLPEAEATCYGFRYRKSHVFLYYLLTVVLLGIPALLGRWFKKYKLVLLCRRVPLRLASVVLVKV